MGFGGDQLTSAYGFRTYGVACGAWGLGFRWLAEDGHRSAESIAGSGRFYARSKKIGVGVWGRPGHSSVEASCEWCLGLSVEDLGRSVQGLWFRVCGWGFGVCDREREGGREKEGGGERERGEGEKQKGMKRERGGREREGATSPQQRGGVLWRSLRCACAPQDVGFRVEGLPYAPYPLPLTPHPKP